MTTATPAWQRLLDQPRHPNATLLRGEIPASAGVYAWFKDDRCVYVGKASSLRSRLSSHRRRSLDLSRSTLRASVAVAEVGVSRAYARRRPSAMTRQQIDVVSAWFTTAQVAWIECTSAGEADELERDLRAAWLPPLNRL